MLEKQTNISEEINHLFRHEYGKIVSVLTKTFGPSQIELAEDVVQDAILEAIKQWSFKGIPDNPIGWIYQVAKHKAVNIVNRDEFKRKYQSEIAHHLQSEWTVEATLDHIFLDKEIADDQLRMMFTCCHPAVSSDSQVALILKTLCGFSIPEIAKAFLTTEENINKRLVRSRKNIREAKVSFEVPVGKELESRLTSVLEAIYLLFNEGYNASSGDDVIRYELCEEAIRMAEIVVKNVNIKAKSTAFALLSLMYLNASRFKSRTDEFNHFVSLQDQDRSSWDRKLIQKGITHLELSAEQNELSIYHILATISAHHCTAKNFEATDWPSILSLYDNLIIFDKSPVVLLNRAVVISKVEGAKIALLEINKIENKEVFKSYLPYYTAMAELHFQNNEIQLAKKYLNLSLQLPIEEKFKQLINNKLEVYSKNI